MATSTTLVKLRHRAAKVGLRFYKSNWRKDSVDNRGGYQVVETSRNVVVNGDRYDLELSEIEQIIKAKEAE